MMKESELKELLYQQIPTSQFMGLKVHTVNKGQVKLSCPLKPNDNHLGTAFGGSLSTMMILAAYSMTYALVEGQGHVLIKACEVDFLHPVTEEIISQALVPGVLETKNFIDTFRRKGRAKITIESFITLKDGKKACRMSAQMVAIT